MKVNCIKFLFAVLVFTCLPLSAQDTAVLELNNNRELFVDYYLIDKLDNLELTLQKPIDEGPVIYFDKPWEGEFSLYTTIIQDGDTYKMYYRGLPDVFKDYADRELTCYAESSDGIHWEKPNLNLYKVNGTFENNVVFIDSQRTNHNFCPMLDANPNVKDSERYKAIGGTYNHGLFAFASPDGIHWKRMQQKAVFKKGKFDSQNVAFWSESEECYVLYFRTWSGGEFDGFRSVSRTTSKDFINWTEPVAMTFGDTPMEHLYTHQTHPYYRAPHIYIAIGARFMPGRQVLTEQQAKDFNVNPKYYKDCSDAVLMSSRGGNVYDRTFMQSFIRPGIGLENWVSRTNYPALNVVQTSPEEMSVYVNHNYAQPTTHLRRYSMRIDGFAALSADFEKGEMVTKPFTFKGNKLVINYSTSAAGEIKVEIQDQNGVAVPGYTLDQSQTIIGNEIERTVSWEKGSNVQELSGKPIRLCFVLKDADLYSCQFKE